MHGTLSNSFQFAYDFKEVSAVSFGSIYINGTSDFSDTAAFENGISLPNISYFSGNSSELNNDALFLKSSGMNYLNVAGSLTIGSSSNLIGSLKVGTGNASWYIGSISGATNGAFIQNSSFNTSNASSFALYQDSSNVSSPSTLVNAPANGQIGLQINNTTCLLLNSAGQVGINNTAPQAALDVTGSAKISSTLTVSSLQASSLSCAFSSMTSAFASTLSVGTILNFSAGGTLGTNLTLSGTLLANSLSAPFASITSAYASTLTALTATITTLSTNNLIAANASLTNVYTSTLTCGSISTTFLNASTLSAGTYLNIVFNQTQAAGTTSSSSGTITVTGGGSFSGTVTATGLGINTTTPLFPLDINGSARFTAGIVPYVNGANSVLNIIPPQTGTNSVLSFNSTVINAGLSNLSIVSPVGIASNWAADALVGDSILRAATGNLRLLAGSGTGNAQVVLSQNNFVGINNPSPQYSLDVSGSCRVTSTLMTNGNNTNFVQLQGGTGTSSEIKFLGSGYAHYSISNNAGTFVISNTSSNSALGTPGNPIIAIGGSGNGNVGINTATPAFQLDVSGSSRTSGFSYMGSSLGIQVYSMGVTMGGSNTVNTYTIPSAITGSKVISLTGMMYMPNNLTYPIGYTADPNYSARVWLTGNTLNVNNLGNSSANYPGTVTMVVSS